MSNIMIPASEPSTAAQSRPTRQRATDSESPPSPAKIHQALQSGVPAVFPAAVMTMSPWLLQACTQLPRTSPRAFPTRLPQTGIQFPYSFHPRPDNVYAFRFGVNPWSFPHTPAFITHNDLVELYEQAGWIVPVNDPVLDVYGYTAAQALEVLWRLPQELAGQVLDWHNQVRHEDENQRAEEVIGIRLGDYNPDVLVTEKTRIINLVICLFEDDSEFVHIAQLHKRLVSAFELTRMDGSHERVVLVGSLDLLKSLTAGDSRFTMRNVCLITIDVLDFSDTFAEHFDTIFFNTTDTREAPQRPTSAPAPDVQEHPAAAAAAADPPEEPQEAATFLNLIKDETKMVPLMRDHRGYFNYLQRTTIAEQDVKRGLFMKLALGRVYANDLQVGSPLKTMFDETFTSADIVLAEAKPKHPSILNLESPDHPWYTSSESLMEVFDYRTILQTLGCLILGKKIPAAGSNGSTAAAQDQVSGLNVDGLPKMNLDPSTSWALWNVFDYISSTIPQCWERLMISLGLAVDSAVDLELPNLNYMEINHLQLSSAEYFGPEGAQERPIAEASPVPMRYRSIEFNKSLDEAAKKWSFMGESSQQRRHHGQELKDFKISLTKQLSALAGRIRDGRGH